jgi:hypothetical protein
MRVIKTRYGLTRTRPQLMNNRRTGASPFLDDASKNGFWSEFERVILLLSPPHPSLKRYSEFVVCRLHWGPEDWKPDDEEMIYMEG